MRVLALDTATEACSVALLTDDGCFAVFEEVGRGHAERVLGMVDETLAEGGVTLGMLDGIAASVGPGSFTGVRICVSVAQGLAFGAGLPAVAVTTLEALALQALRWPRGAAFLPGAALSPGLDQVLACLDARMGEVYWGCFRADAARGLAARGPLAVGAADSVRVPFTGPFYGIGRGIAAYPSLEALPGLVLPGGPEPPDAHRAAPDPRRRGALDARQALPDARDMARLGAIRLGAGEGRDPAELAPQYVRDKVALTEVEREAVRAAADRAKQGPG